MVISSFSLTACFSSAILAKVRLLLAVYSAVTAFSRLMLLRFRFQIYSFGINTNSITEMNASTHIPALTSAPFPVQTFITT